MPEQVASTTVSSIEELIAQVRDDRKTWGDNPLVWFRGEPNDTATPLVPKVFRRNYDENALLQDFRKKAPTLSPGPTPSRGHTDEWLFLAQHVGLPTRLLDWTESLLIATYFSLQYGDRGSALWMLNPLELNRRVAGSPTIGLTWLSPELNSTAWLKALLEPDRRIRNPLDNYLLRFLGRLRRAKVVPNASNRNIRGAWENDKVGTQLPVAIYPSSVHPRISIQKSAFTIHRKSHPNLMSITGSALLFKYVIADSAHRSFLEDLEYLGITQTTIYPDLEGLATELDMKHKK